jgi:hypothetical protein
MMMMNDDYMQLMRTKLSMVVVDGDDDGLAAGVQV